MQQQAQQATNVHHPMAAWHHGAAPASQAPPRGYHLDNGTGALKVFFHDDADGGNSAAITAKSKTKSNQVWRAGWAVLFALCMLSAIFFFIFA